jgi:hypothetical protein
MSKMKLKLTDTNIEEFLIRLYFEKSETFHKAAAKRAYRDFSRTLRDLSTDENEKRDAKNTVEDSLLERINVVLTSDFENQDEFDLWHQKTCEIIMSKSSIMFNSSILKLKVGQAQKWINMTLKYMYTLKESRIAGINRNVCYFHVPIDNIIQEEFSKDKKIQSLNVRWSRIESYPVYLNYQKIIRENYEGKIPFEVEFLLFNKTDTPL